jgi:hypothetical protein
MATIRRSPLAEQDFRDIWRHIAQDNPDAADRLLRRFDESWNCMRGGRTWGRTGAGWLVGCAAFLWETTSCFTGW